MSAADSHSHKLFRFYWRLNKPFHFTARPHERVPMAPQSTFYSLFICKEDLISSLLSTHKVSVTMGTVSARLCSVALRPVPLWQETTAVFTFWQANRLIKGSHVCFCARYLALSKHRHISTTQTLQSQHFLPYCGGRPWHVELAVHFCSPCKFWPSCQWLLKNACLIEKFSQGLRRRNAKTLPVRCSDAVNVVHV